MGHRGQSRLVRPTSRSSSRTVALLWATLKLTVRFLRVADIKAATTVSVMRAEREHEVDEDAARLRKIAKAKPVERS